MKNLLLIISLFILIIACGSSNSNPKARSFKHLEAVFYALDDNFTLIESPNAGRVLSDDDLTGNNNDFVETLKARLIADGFFLSDMTMVETTYATDEGELRQAGVRVKTSTGGLYICDSFGITKVDLSGNWWDYP